MKLSLHEAETWAIAILEKHGSSKEDANTVSKHLIDAELHGNHIMGLAKLPRLVEFLHDTQRSDIVIEKETAISTVLNAKNNLGYVVARRMVDTAIEKASRQDVSVVAAYNCVLTGRNGYYMDLVARQGFIGIMMNNAPPLVAPWGASEAIFGTNPFSVGMPTSSDPLIFDIGTASAMDGDLRLRMIEKRSLPEGIAFDSEGNPTVDPTEVLKEGAVTTFGGHKGSGLALIVQAFGILANSPPIPGTPEQSGVFMMVLSPDLLLPRTEFTSRLDVLLDKVRSARPVHQGSEVYVPGDRSGGEMKRRLKEEEIEISEEVAQALKGL